MVDVKFLGLQIDSHLTWKNYIKQMIPMLSGACYAVRSVVHISNINTHKSIYCTYFHCYKIRNNFFAQLLQQTRLDSMALQSL
jgi:hypothetical protein